MLRPMAPLDGTLAGCAYRKCYGVHMIFRRTLLAGLLVFAVAACGGDDASKVEDALDALADEANNSDASVEANTDQEDVDAMTENTTFTPTGNKCLDAVQAWGLALAAISNSILDIETFDPDAYNTNMNLAREVIDDSIKADFGKVADAYDTLVEGIIEAQDAGGFSTPAGVDALDDINEVFQDATVQEATAKVGTYFSSDCLQAYGN